MPSTLMDLLQEYLDLTGEEDFPALPPEGPKGEEKITTQSIKRFLTRQLILS